MKENTGIKKYVLTRQAHFGYTKQSYVGGTVFIVDYEKGKYTANGSSFNDLRDINIAVRAGFMDAFSETVKNEIDEKIKKQEEFYEKVSESKKEKPVKMEVIKSDEDLIEPIPIKNKKEETKEEENKQMEVITENSDDTARGMTVVRSQPQELEESSQGTVVAIIGGDKNTSVKTANKDEKPKRSRSKKSEEKALENAEKRRQDALNKRKASKKAKEEK